MLTSVEKVEQVDKFPIETAPEAGAKAVDIPGYDPHAGLHIAQGQCLVHIASSWL